MELIGVTNDRLPAHRLAEVLSEAGPYLDRVILREKSKTDRELAGLIETLLDNQVPKDKLIVHGRADIAKIFKMPRVQMPGHGIPLPLAAEHFPGIRFGASVHSTEEAEQAQAGGADWLLYGHLYKTRSKEGLAGRGTDELAELIKAVSIPVYAIGGIQPGHVKHLQEIGVAGIAVMSSIFGAPDPVRSALSYRHQWEGSEE